MGDGAGNLLYKTIEKQYHYRNNTKSIRILI